MDERRSILLSIRDLRVFEEDGCSRGNAALIAMAKRTFIVTYDVSSPRRWRHVYRLMRSFGEHIQLSVFRCDLNAAQRVRLRSALDEVIHHHEDQVFIIDIGETTVQSLRGIDVLGRPHAFRVPVARII